MSRALLNLVQNAVRYANSRVEIGDAQRRRGIRADRRRRRRRHPASRPRAGVRTVHPPGRKPRPRHRRLAWGWPSCNGWPLITAAPSRCGTVPGRRPLLRCAGRPEDALLRGVAARQQLIDAQPVAARHLEGPSAPCDRFTGVRDAADDAQQATRQRCVRRILPRLHPYPAAGPPRRPPGRPRAARSRRTAAPPRAGLRGALGNSPPTAVNTSIGVTSPSQSPCSSTTISMWSREARSSSSTFSTGVVSSTYSGSRASSTRSMGPDWTTAAARP